MIGPLFLLIFVVVAVWSWVGLTLAECGVFGPSTLMALGMLGSTGAAWAAWRGRSLDARTGRASAWLGVAGCLTAAVLLFGPPGEYAIDGADGSVYLNIGAAVARHGGLNFDEPVFDAIKEAERPAVFHMHHNYEPVYDFFPGGIQVPINEHQVRPGFFHLYPVWIAIADTVGGLRAGYRVTWAFGLLSVFAVWVLGRELAGLVGANVAAGLLCLNYAQVWVVRIPASEVLAEYFILAGLAFIIGAARTASRLTAACAGIAFGLAACTRLDALLLISPLVAGCLGMIAFSRRWSTVWTTMAIPFAVLTAQAALHGLFISTPYTLRVLWWMLAGRQVSYLALVVPVVVVAAGLLLWMAWSGREGRAPGWLTSVALSALLLLAGIRLGPELTVGYLSMVLTPIGSALAIGGACWLVRRGHSPERLLVVAIPLVTAMVYAESLRDEQGLPQLLRRFVPAILPLALVFIGSGVAQIAAVAGRWRVAVFVVPLLVGALFARETRPLLAQAPMQGMHDQLASVAQSLPAKAVLMVDASTPSHFGLSLHYMFGHDVLFISPGAGARDAVRRFVSDLVRGGRPILLAAGREGASDPTLNATILAGLQLTPAGTVTLQSTQLEATSTRLPSTVVPVSSTLEFYQVGIATPATLPIEIDIGDHDIGWRASGFHGYELMGSAGGRWTGASASIVLPRIAADSSSVAMLVRLAAYRPAGFEPPRVELALDDQPLAVTPPLVSDFRVIEVVLPAWAAERLQHGPARLTLRAPTFVPSAEGVGDDSRALGVALDWIRIEGR